MAFRTSFIENLPVELLHEIQLIALSEHLPYASRNLFAILTNASPYFKTQYIMGRILIDKDYGLPSIYTRALRYPICTQPVLQVLHNHLKDRVSNSKVYVHLPARLFRSLSLPVSGWTRKHEPIPLLRYLLETPGMPKVDVNYPDGYALTKAVHAKFIPLVELLLDHRASPKYREKLALKVAIRQKDLTMLKFLVERRSTKKSKHKKMKLEDRVQLDPQLLKIAVSVGAVDIVDYICREKAIVPDVQTLKSMK